MNGSDNEVIDRFAEDGYVVLRGVVPLDPLRRLQARMDRDTVDLLRFCERLGGNPRDVGHLQQGPPPFADFVFPEVVANDAVMDVCEQIVGARPALTFYNGNTNFPGSTTQRLHMDSGHRSTPGEPALPTHSVVVNVPPGPMDESNGAIELWPGTHRVPYFSRDNRIDDETQASLRETTTPVQISAAAGDVLIRDMRLWHRGVPNGSTRARHMIALVLTARSALDEKQRLTFGAGCEAAFANGRVDPNADFVRDSIDYLFAPTMRVWRRRQTGG